MALGWVVDGLVYLTFGVLNAEGANTGGRPPVHTVLIRVAMSWGLAMSPLKEFSLSHLPLFSWSLSRASGEIAERALLAFPPSLENSYRVVHAFLQGYVPEVAPTLPGPQSSGMQEHEEGNL